MVAAKNHFRDAVPALIGSLEEMSDCAERKDK